MVGEKKAPPSAKVLNCPACGASVVIRAQGHSVTAICSSCNSQIDPNEDSLRVLSKIKQTQERTQVIELGKRGKIHGTLWEAIGYMERSDETGIFTWSEYLLFNPMKGFRWLTEFNGHWNYVVTTKNQPHLSVTGQEAAYLDKTYHLFHQGQARVNFVMGEFYWQVRQGSTVIVHDYINPPEMLSSEKDDSEVVWSISEYIKPQVVKEGFAITTPMPLEIGVAPNQPSTLLKSSRDVLNAYGIFLGILVLLQVIFVFFAKNEVVFRGNYTFSVNDPEKLKVTPQFELTGGTSNLQIDLDVPRLYNGWLEIEADLINDDTGENMEFEHGTEVYHGRDSDGSWKEGSTSNDLILSRVPAGKYHINFQTASLSGSTWASVNEPLETSYEVQVRRGVPTWKNFLWAIALLSIFPVVTWWRNRSFEVNRWSTSDFSPYYSGNDEDEE